MVDHWASLNPQPNAPQNRLCPACRALQTPLAGKARCRKKKQFRRLNIVLLSHCQQKNSRFYDIIWSYHITLFFSWGLYEHSLYAHRLLSFHRWFSLGLSLRQLGGACLHPCLFRCSGCSCLRVFRCRLVILSLVGCSLWGFVLCSSRCCSWPLGGFGAVPVGCPCSAWRSTPVRWCLVRLMCGPHCTSVRCPSCPPASGPVHFVRLSAVVRSCLCPGCQSWALVLESGAERPFCLCVVCGACLPAPASSSWRSGSPATLNRPTPGATQLSLF